MPQRYSTYMIFLREKKGVLTRIRVCHQFIIAASGSFEVSLYDGENRKTSISSSRFFWTTYSSWDFGHELNFLQVPFAWYWLHIDLMNQIIFENMEITKNL